MKVKIRGLVFAGFAAAVFAQSASAEITDSDKTVTSKTYVDSKIEGTVSDATTINSGSPDDKAPSSLNVYKFVTDQMDDLAEVAAIKGDDTYLNVRTVTVNEGQANEYEAKQVEVITNNLASTAALIGTAGTSAQAADQGKLTTAKAVYDFVNGGDGTGFQRKLTAQENPSLGVYNADGTSVWRAAQGGTYVTMDASGTGAITFDVPSNKIATIGADDPSTQAVEVSEITADSTKLTTGKAVYEFVTQQVNEAAGDFQPKLTAAQASVLAGWGNGGQSDEGTAIEVGYRAYDSENPNAVEPSEWKTFGARANGSGTSNDYHLSYLTVQPGSAQERDKYFIDIKAGALAKDVVTINAGGTATGANASLTADKLTTAKAVYDYAVKQQWDATNDVGKHLVIDSDGKVTVSTTANPDIPLPTACATGTNVCALVAHLNSAGTSIEYEWTVMAGTGN